MSDPTRATPQDRLLAATRRATLAEALAWIADGYPLSGNAQLLIRDLAALDSSPAVQSAAQTLTRQLSQSSFDSASVLFRTDTVATPGDFRRALDRLAALSPDHSLGTVNANSVIAAQRDDPFTIEALCSVAGLSYTDLQERVAGLPGSPRSSWTPSQVKSAFAVIDGIVSGSVKTEVAGAVAMRPIDLLSEIAGSRSLAGWALVEDQRVRGVSYETLLAQRAAGGAWLAHRNSTSSMLNQPLAQRLAEALDDRGISYRRSSSLGGDVQPSLLQKLAKSDAQIGLLVVDRRGEPRYAVAFSSARDSGTARKNAGSLRNMRRDQRLPMAIVVSGRGWAQRNETADLALAFGGRLFADSAINALAEDITSTLADSTREGDPNDRR